MIPQPIGLQNKGFCNRRDAIGILALTASNVLGFNGKVLAQAEENPYPSLSAEEKSHNIEYERMVTRFETYFLPRMSNQVLLKKSLRPESFLDLREDQQKIFGRVAAGEKKFEFGKGYLYHGHRKLGQVLNQGSLEANSFVTRVPQTWAIRPFVDLEEEPAIFMIDACDFNRAQQRGEAHINLSKPDRGERAGEYICEVFPYYKSTIDLDSVKKIITTKRTYEKYKKICEEVESQATINQPETLEQSQKKLLAKRIRKLLDEKRILYFDPNGEYEGITIQNTREERFLNMHTLLSNYMRDRMIDGMLPVFQDIDPNGEHAKTAAPLEQDTLSLVKAFADSEVSGLMRDFVAKAKADKEAKEQLSEYTIVAFLAGLLGLAGAAGRNHIKNLFGIK